MEFPIVFTALTFMLITNFLYASIGGFNFLDAISVGQASNYQVSADCAEALDYYNTARGKLTCAPLSPCTSGTLDQILITNIAATGGVVLGNWQNRPGSIEYVEVFCADEMKQYGITRSNVSLLQTSYSIDPTKLTSITSIGNSTEAGFLSNVYSVMNAISYAFNSAVSGIVTFVSIVFQVMTYSWGGPLASVMTMINGLCILVTSVWVYKAIVPSGN